MSSVKVTNLLHGSSASNNIVLASDGTTTVPNLKATTELLVGGVSSTANGGTLQISNGITFPATQSACSDANTLDDYEEGTWTPIDGSTAGLTFSGATGSYTKTGRTVIAHYEVNYPSTADGSIAVIGGLPFTIASGSYHNSLGITDYGNSNITVMTTPNTTSIRPRNFSNGNLTNANLSGKFFYGTCVYRV